MIVPAILATRARRRFIPAIALLIVLTAGVVSSGQAPQATKTSREPDESTVILAGDMLIPRDLAEVLFGRLSRRQSASIFHPNYPWLSPWPLGLIPIRFAPDVSPQRQGVIWEACSRWQRSGPVVCIPHSVEETYVLVKQDQPGCFANLGAQGGQPRVINLGTGCWSPRPALHELGHILGFIHEHQRADRDEYIEIDIDNVIPEFRYAFARVADAMPHSAYDFFSTMHYPPGGFAIEPRANIIARPQFVETYAEATKRYGEGNPSASDLAAAASIYSGTLRAYGSGRPTESVRRQFSRDDFLGAMNQLHGFYQSSLGLHRPNGVSLGGRPDFLAIAQWIFDVYLGARSAGFSRDSAFDIVVAAITQTEEWKAKHPGTRSLTPTPFTPYVSFDRNEFLSTLERLDRFYSSAEGLQRPDGLSIDGAPDFQGIATWIFDVYLSQRLTGASPNAAWIAVENAIKATEEWRRKH